MLKEKPELGIIFSIILIFFVAFLFAPLFVLLVKSLQVGDSFGLANYLLIVTDKGIVKALRNSLFVSTLTAVISTFLAFVLAYAVNFTKISGKLKKFIELTILLPMLLPSITYGFAIMYSFGKQGLITKLLGFELFEIYGFNGLLLGYVIYTVPCVFLLLNNAFGYVDRKFFVVSALMGDSAGRRFVNTVFRPLVPSICGGLVISFVLSFTDFGIPASLGGIYSVVPTQLYQVMLGALPDFNTGSVIAMLMLLPAVFALCFLSYMERFNFHYDSFSRGELSENKLRDRVFAVFSLLLMVGLLATFSVMFILPLVANFPYDMSFSTKFLRQALFSQNILYVYKNSLLVAMFAAVLGTTISYAAALLNMRSKMTARKKRLLDFCALVANTVPGMVLGLGYLMFFNDSDFKGTFAIIVICNVVHFFATPYLMAKNSLGKLNPVWETTGELMGDSWIKTVFKVIIPNSITAVVDMWGYYFINAMVTISAVIFLVTARTSVITSQIKELQHYANFNEIFVLSILIFLTNMVVKIVCDFAVKKLSIE